MKLTSFINEEKKGYMKLHNWNWVDMNHYIIEGENEERNRYKDSFPQLFTEIET